MEIYLKGPLSGASTASRMRTVLADRETVGKREKTRWHLKTFEFLARGISPQASRQVSSTTDANGVLPQGIHGSWGPHRGTQAYSSLGCCPGVEGRTLSLCREEEVSRQR